MSEKRMRSLRRIAMAIFTEKAMKSGLSSNLYVRIEGKYLNWNQFFKKFKKDYKKGVPKDAKKETKKKREKDPEKNNKKECKESAEKAQETR
ncbi:MAG: hypothetical protein JRJ39_00205 [Deltaproteobacteria bacterium]|nr:hypothetical protein [Deltaproteobacteria bacterium]MBW2334507.1 hypothetical protein [Deltaproteobacteria bacterium]